jgi:hypothetical protein
MTAGRITVAERLAAVLFQQEAREKCRQVAGSKAVFIFKEVVYIADGYLPVTAK